MTATFGIIHRFNGATVEQYENTVKVVHPDRGKGLPPGQLYHAADPIEAGAPADGVIVVAIWDSEASWVKFRDRTLLPGLARVENGPLHPPVETTFQVTNVVSTRNAVPV